MGKKFLKITLFICLLIGGLSYTYSVLSLKMQPGLPNMYKLEKNSVDVMFYGSSHCNYTINNAILWKDYGIASYDMVGGGQNLGSTYYYMEETLKTQKPALMAVDLVFTSWRRTGLEDGGNIYRNTINMHWSKTFFENLNYAVDLAEGSEEIKEAIALKYPVTHTRYSDLTEADFERDGYLRGGYNPSWTKDHYKESEVKKFMSDEIGELREDDKMYLEKMIDLTDKNDIELIFFISPYVLREGDAPYFNAAEQFAEEHNIPFLNFNKMYDQIGFDFDNDMRAEKHAGSHMNNFGSAKVTNYFGEYITENYTLPNLWKNGGQEYFDAVAQYWEHMEQNYEISRLNNTNEYLEYMITLMQNHKGYMVMVAVDGAGFNDEELSASLKKIGIGQEELGTGGHWIFLDGEAQFSSQGKDDFLYYKELENHKFALQGINGNWNFMLDKEKSGKITDGLNIFVYDQITEKIVDKIGIDSTGKIVR